MKPHENLDPLLIAGKSYASRLLIGTGKYKDFAETRAAVDASGVALASIQALYERVEKLSRDNAALERRVRELESTRP